MVRAETFFERFYPNAILTPYLNISNVYISKESLVIVRAEYGNLDFYCKYKPIEFVTTFDKLYDLLSEKVYGANELLDELSTAVSSFSDHGICDVYAPVGVPYWGHIFSFYRDGNAPGTFYQLKGYIKRNKILPSFVGFKYPDTINGTKSLKSKYLKMQYNMYLHLRQTYSKEQALAYSDLKDPLTFAAAKKKYERKYVRKDTQ